MREVAQFDLEITFKNGQQLNLIIEEDISSDYTYTKHFTIDRFGPDDPRYNRAKIVRERQKSLEDSLHEADEVTIHAVDGVYQFKQDDILYTRFQERFAEPDMEC
jgi:hypothetical protein